MQQARGGGAVVVLFSMPLSSNEYFSPYRPATGSRETTGVQLMARGSRKDAQVYPTVQRADLDEVVNNTAASEQEYRATVSERSAHPGNEYSTLEASLLRHGDDVREFVITLRGWDRAVPTVT